MQNLHAAGILKKKKKKKLEISTKQTTKHIETNVQNLHAAVVFSNLNNLNSKAKMLSASKDCDPRRKV